MARNLTIFNWRLLILLLSVYAQNVTSLWGKWKYRIVKKNQFFGKISLFREKNKAEKKKITNTSKKHAVLRINTLPK